MPKKSLITKANTNQTYLLALTLSLNVQKKQTPSLTRSLIIRFPVIISSRIFRSEQQHHSSAPASPSTVSSLGASLGRDQVSNRSSSCHFLLGDGLTELSTIVGSCTVDRVCCSLLLRGKIRGCKADDSSCSSSDLVELTSWVSWWWWWRGVSP